MHSHPRRILLALALAGWLLGGCQTTATDESMGASPSASPPAADILAFFECEPVNLRMPDGSAIRLDGTWVADDGGTYLIREARGCLIFGSGGSVAHGERGGAQDRSRVFVGRIYQDFTVQGWFGETIGPDLTADNNGFHLRIDLVETADGVTHVRLSRYYDNGGEMNGWHQHCFVPIADVPSDGIVYSEMCPREDPVLGQAPPANAASSRT